MSPLDLNEGSVLLILWISNTAVVKCREIGNDLNRLEGRLDCLELSSLELYFS